MGDETFRDDLEDYKDEAYFDEDDSDHAGAVLFAERCSGCHTLSAAGTQGSGERNLRQQGPNFDERIEAFDDTLFAVRNGGFSGAIMPQNIVVGEDAEKVAQFVADWSGIDVETPLSPAAGAESSAGGDEGAE